MQLVDACTEFLNHCENVKKLSPLTLRAYRRDLASFREIVGIDAELQDFSQTWIEDAVRKWSENPDLKMTTIKRRVACVKVFVRRLYRCRMIPSNPLERLHLEIRLPKRLPRNLQTDEIRKLVAVQPDNLQRNSNIDARYSAGRKTWDMLTARLAIEVMALTGIRVGELVKIKLHDIDHALHQLKINGKGNRERQVSFPDTVTLERLHIYRAQAERALCCANESSLFLNGLGRPANEQYIRRVIRKFAEVMEIKRRITPHMLRHTAATQLLEAGLDIRFLQKLLGHASITTTEIYTHVADQTLRAEIARVNIRERLEMNR